MPQNSLDKFFFKEHQALGRTKFFPPFRISDSLINEARIVHVIKGNSKLHSVNQITELKSGDTIVMKTDQFVNHWLENEDNSQNEVIVFQLSSNLIKELYQGSPTSWFSKKGEKINNSTLRAKPNPIITNYFHSLLQLINSPSFLTEELIEVKIKKVISLLIASDFENNAKNIFNNLFNPNGYVFQEVIQQNIFEDLSIEELSFLTNHSLSSFKRKFSDYYGTSLTKYITSKRLEKAQTLLRTRNTPISDIAYECGFSDLGYFSKTFKKHFNITPSEFKAENLN